MGGTSRPGRPTQRPRQSSVTRSVYEFFSRLRPSKRPEKGGTLVYLNAGAGATTGSLADDERRRGRRHDESRRGRRRDESRRGRRRDGHHHRGANRSTSRHRHRHHRHRRRDEDGKAEEVEEVVLLRPGSRPARSASRHAHGYRTRPTVTIAAPRGRHAGECDDEWATTATSTPTRAHSLDRYGSHAIRRCLSNDRKPMAAATNAAAAAAAAELGWHRPTASAAHNINAHRSRSQSVGTRAPCLTGSRSSRGMAQWQAGGGPERADGFRLHNYSLPELPSALRGHAAAASQQSLRGEEGHGLPYPDSVADNEARPTTARHASSLRIVPPAPPPPPSMFYHPQAGEPTPPPSSHGYRPQQQQQQPSSLPPELPASNLALPPDLYHAKLAHRRQRRVLLSNGDFLGVTGFNPFTGQPDVITPPTSSEDMAATSVTSSRATAGQDEAEEMLLGAGDDGAWNHPRDGQGVRRQASAASEQRKRDEKEARRALREAERVLRAEQRKARAREEVVRSGVTWRKDQRGWSSVPGPPPSSPLPPLPPLSLRPGMGIGIGMGMGMGKGSGLAAADTGPSPVSSGPSQAVPKKAKEIPSPSRSNRRERAAEFGERSSSESFLGIAAVAGRRNRCRRDLGGRNLTTRMGMRRAGWLPFGPAAEKRGRCRRVTTTCKAHRSVARRFLGREDFQGLRTFRLAALPNRPPSHLVVVTACNPSSICLESGPRRTSGTWMRALEGPAPRDMGTKSSLHFRTTFSSRLEGPREPIQTAAAGRGRD
ncbi:hypothetical protein VTJ83DRAFT_4736 [Remersonia thermophila]|uniref:Uncharacterized protein n=1 Tax=Remersonia thermophila TaxID=72144 RepID=A0ABR4DAS7_9PEZI